MKPDLDQFLPHIQDSDMSDQQKREFLAEMWKVIEIFVDLGFGIEATQNVLFSNQMNPSQVDKDSLRFKFNDSAKQSKYEPPEEAKPANHKGVRYE